MNKTVGFILGGLVFILLVALVAQTAYFAGKKDNSGTKKGIIGNEKMDNIGSARNNKDVKNETNKNGSKGMLNKGNENKNTDITKNNVSSGVNNKIVEVDDSWFWYVNKSRGFKIKLPKETRLDGAVYKVKAMVEGPITYISSSKFVEGEIVEHQSRATSVYDKASGVGFAILVQEVKDKQALEQFIKDRYALHCELGTIKPTSKKGMFDVSIGGMVSDPGNIGKNDCFINYMTVIKYSPDKKLVAAWDIGQAPNFWIDGKATLDGKVGKAIDTIISDSFEFLK